MEFLGWGPSPVTENGGLSLASNEIINELFLLPFPSPQRSFWIILHVPFEKGKPLVLLHGNLPHCDYKRNSTRRSLDFMWVCCRRILV